MSKSVGMEGDGVFMAEEVRGARRPPGPSVSSLSLKISRNPLKVMPSVINSPSLHSKKFLEGSRLLSPKFETGYVKFM